MIKIIASLIIIFFMSPFALAKVIELDNQNIAHCQEQLKNDTWERNVVMLYVKGSPGIDEFHAIYAQVSNKYPKRHLFALNVFDPKADAKKNQISWETAKGCLTNMMSADYMGVINSNTPALLLHDYNRAKVGLGNHGVSTEADLIEFMQ